MALKASEYDVVVAESEIELVQEVNQRIAKGWHPLGGPSVFIRLDGTQAVLQAVIRESSRT
jgi:hypothetical protein